MTKKMDELVTIFNDDRNRKILNAASNEDGISTKELARQLNIKASNLYYPIQKLTEIQLLEVVGTRQVKNLTEKLYRSASVFQKDSQSINITQDYAKQHPELLMSLFLAEQQDARQAYEDNLDQVREQKLSDDELMTWIGGSMKMPLSQKSQFVKEFLDLTKRYEDQNKNLDNTENFVVDFSMFRKNN